MFKPADLFDLAQTEHAAIFDGCQFAWDALKKIEAYLDKVQRQNPPDAFPARASANACSSVKALSWSPAR